jgi:hypothetical protein
MTGATPRHVLLVNALLQAIEEKHNSPKKLLVFADLARFGNNRPPMVGGFVPDVYAHDLPITSRIVGEAKTERDFETDRSRLQLAAFLDHLCLYQQSTFYVAVPWAFAPRARSLLRALQNGAHRAVQVHVLPIAIG